jgi:ABC-type uncharacterized transport system involved in gliding motility auxiliary subunit
MKKPAVSKKFSFAQLKQVNIVSWLGLYRYKMQAIILIALALFVVSNIMLTVVSARLDFSKGKIYTLSSSTKNIINKLDDNVTITFYVSSAIPTQLQTLERDVRDLLQEYDRVSGRVNVKVVEVSDEPASIQKVQAEGVEVLEYSQVGVSNMERKAFFFGLVISYKDRKEVLPRVVDIGSLEYNITSSVYKLTNKELPQVAMVGYEPPVIPQMPDSLADFKKFIEKQFSLQYVAAPTPTPAPAAEGEEVAPPPVTAAEPFALKPEYKTTLLFDNGTGTYGNAEVTSIKKYIQNGGNIIFFVNGVNVSEQQLQAAPATHNLFNLLKEYGIEVQKNVVLSTASERINAGNGVFTLLLPYPAWLQTNVFDEKSSYFSNVSVLSYLWSSSLKVQNSTKNAVTELVKTTKESWQQSSNFQIAPQQIPNPAEKDLQQFTVTAESKNKERGNVMVISSGKFIDQQYLSSTSNNIDFVVNVLNDYASGGALAGIPLRDVSLYPLPQLDNTMKEVFKYGNVIALPAIFILYGAYRLLRRNKSSV